MDVRVDAARGDDAAFAGDRFGAGADHDVDSGLDVGIARLTDAADAAVADSDVRLDDAPMVEDHGIGDDRVDRPFRAGCLPLPHPVTDHLAAAELDLLAVDRAVALDLDDEFGVGEAQPIARRRAEHRGVSSARYRRGHQIAPFILPLKPTTRRAPA